METKHITLTWTGGLRFEGGEPGGPVSHVDGDNATAPGPMLHLLLAAASCSAADVVENRHGKKAVPTKATPFPGLARTRRKMPARVEAMTHG